MSSDYGGSTIRGIHLCCWFRCNKRLNAGEPHNVEKNNLATLYESSGVFSVSGFLHLYHYFYISDNSVLQLLQSFARTTSVALATEWFFTSLSLAIETRYQNMPVMAVWRRKWKRHIVVAIINAVVIAIWLSSRLILPAVVNNGHYVGKPRDFCQMPFGS